jgi:hypothetical protein
MFDDGTIKYEALADDDHSESIRATFEFQDFSIRIP